MPKDKIKWGIIGIGAMGESHAQTLLSNSVKNAELNAVCDIDVKCKDKFPGIKFYTNSNDLFKDKSIDAQLIAIDQSLDLALLKTDVRPKEFLNLSDDPPKKLQKIYVAGYPFGKGLSDDLKFTQGIISSVKGFADNSNQIQIDAAINSGNSGGPIVNEDGDLIAVAVSGFDKSASEIMTKNPTLANKNMLVGEAINLMNTKKITSLFICDKKIPLGIVHIRLTS